jgi:hypothetical protein
MNKKGRPGPRPNMWKTGPDELLHKKYRQWVQQRNQAVWRGESWDLTFELWCELWGDKFELRGRRPEDYCMTRRDATDAWTKDNAIVVTRDEHFNKYRNRGKFAGNEEREF